MANSEFVGRSMAPPRFLKNHVGCGPHAFNNCEFVPPAMAREAGMAVMARLSRCGICAQRDVPFRFCGLQSRRPDDRRQRAFNGVKQRFQGNRRTN
jgi:hypothetical protein